MTDGSKPFGLIFVGGAPRSGTTLVQRILGAHSQVYAGPEFDLVPEIMRLRLRFLQDVEAGRIATYLDGSGVNRSFEIFLRAIFQGKIAETGRIYFSEKTPANLEVFPELQDCLPGARFIFIMRDPRAVVASMLEVGRKIRADLRWSQVVQAVRRVFAGTQWKRGAVTLPPYFTRNTHYAVDYINLLWSRGNIAREQAQNILVIYYEDLVSRPEAEARKMAEFLGIPFEQGMLAIQDAHLDLPGFQAGEHYWYTREQLQGSIEQHSTDKWRASLKPYDLHVIRKYLKPIPGLTDRYNLEADSKPWWILADLWGEVRVRLRRFLLKLTTAFSKVL